MSRNKEKLKVVDFFCGAGGFSEGFRQQGFDVVMGIDYWQPAINTHNLNHGLKDVTKNILDFWGDDSSDIEEIKKIPNTEVIVGSPSCTSFSMSNRAGKADKVHGVKLIEVFLRVIAVKKHQNKSLLKVWYMENVPTSRNFIKRKYTFRDLNLSKWAIKINKKPTDIALMIGGGVFNAGDYGAPQERNRFIAGEWIKTGEFLIPQKTHERHAKLSDLRAKMPRPNIKKTNKKWSDPNYSNLILYTNEITDHFYDTGLYKIEWEKAEHLKTNHPFMGKMSFPENENRNCRTITATRSASTREALIYKSEYKRKGDGEYRLPTIREISTLMGFPYVYQFIGSENIKWKLIGNAVCPHLASALAKSVRKKMKLPEIEVKDINFSEMKKNFTKVHNLDTFKEGVFNNPKKRQSGSRFRRHPIKLGNMTVDLLNYHPQNKNVIAKNWFVGAFFGTGKNHKYKLFYKDDITKIEKYLKTHLNDFARFKKQTCFNVVFLDLLQKIYEEDLLLKSRQNPINIVKRMREVILSHKDYKMLIKVEGFPKKNLPLGQLMAIHSLLRLVFKNRDNSFCQIVPSEKVRIKDKDIIEIV